MPGHGMSLFNAISPRFSITAVLLSPFALWPVFPASDYYGDSAPQQSSADHTLAFHLAV